MTAVWVIVGGRAMRLLAREWLQSKRPQQLSADTVTARHDDVTPHYANPVSQPILGAPVAVCVVLLKDTVEMLTNVVGGSIPMVFQV